VAAAAASDGGGDARPPAHDRRPSAAGVVGATGAAAAALPLPPRCRCRRAAAAAAAVVVVVPPSLPHGGEATGGGGGGGGRGTRRERLPQRQQRQLGWRWLQSRRRRRKRRCRLQRRRERLPPTRAPATQRALQRLARHGGGAGPSPVPWRVGEVGRCRPHRATATASAGAATAATAGLPHTVGGASAGAQRSVAASLLRRRAVDAERLRFPRPPVSGIACAVRCEGVGGVGCGGRFATAAVVCRRYPYWRWPCPARPIIRLRVERGRAGWRAGGWAGGTPLCRLRAGDRRREAASAVAPAVSPAAALCGPRRRADCGLRSQRTWRTGEGSLAGGPPTYRDPTRRDGSGASTAAAAG